MHAYFEITTKNLLLQVLLSVAYISSVNKHLSATENKKMRTKCKTLKRFPQPN